MRTLLFISAILLHIATMAQNIYYGKGRQYVHAVTAKGDSISLYINVVYDNGKDTIIVRSVTYQDGVPPIETIATSSNYATCKANMFTYEADKLKLTITP
jgi:hypothetical protein